LYTRLRCRSLSSPRQIALAILIASVRLIRLVHLVTGPWRTVAWHAVLGIARQAIRNVLAWLTRTGAKTEHEDQ